MNRFAEGTSVPVLKSRMEIEQLLTKYGATTRAVMEEPGRAVIQFGLMDRHVRFTMKIASDDDAAKELRRGRQLSPAARRDWLERRHREQWRALLLVLKAKFTALEGQVETFEECFLSHIVMPGGKTLGQLALPAIATAYKTGTVSPGFLLGAGEARS